jgi:putative ABC transport system ATP-binding protein
VQNAVRTDSDPLSQLVSAAAEVYMKVSPVRQPLAEVLWHARHDMPVVIWSAKEQRWIVVTFAGWFRLRIADGDHPTHRVSISRSELVRLAGAEKRE